jgi:hypothetical protein
MIRESPQRAIGGQKRIPLYVKWVMGRFTKQEYPETADRQDQEIKTEQEHRKDLKDLPLFLSPILSLCPMVRRPNGLSCFRALEPEQKKVVRILRVR